MKTQCPKCKKYFTESYLNRLSGIDRCCIGMSKQEKEEAFKRWDNMMFCNHCGWEWNK